MISATLLAFAPCALLPAPRVSPGAVRGRAVGASAVHSPLAAKALDHVSSHPVVEHNPYCDWFSKAPHRRPEISRQRAGCTALSTHPTPIAAKSADTRPWPALGRGDRRAGQGSRCAVLRLFQPLPPRPTEQGHQLAHAGGRTRGQGDSGQRDWGGLQAAGEEDGRAGARGGRERVRSERRLCHRLRRGRRLLAPRCALRVALRRRQGHGAVL
mmetsp:Transcript_21580/g.71317  ORF Transcript_21580/g.71317 Transcript_21580/m.71317 type:complete len:213 (-) Transcript_21580:344-982(-)